MADDEALLGVTSTAELIAVAGELLDHHVRLRNPVALALPGDEFPREDPVTQRERLELGVLGVIELLAPLFLRLLEQEGVVPGLGQCSRPFASELVQLRTEIDASHRPLVEIGGWKFIRCEPELQVHGCEPSARVHPIVVVQLGTQSCLFERAAWI